MSDSTQINPRLPLGWRWSLSPGVFLLLMVLAWHIAFRGANGDEHAGRAGGIFLMLALPPLWLIGTGINICWWKRFNVPNRIIFVLLAISVPALFVLPMVFVFVWALLTNVLGLFQ